MDHLDITILGLAIHAQGTTAVAGFYYYGSVGEFASQEVMAKRVSSIRW
jgi:hypothetical protein